MTPLKWGTWRVEIVRTESRAVAGRKKKNLFTGGSVSVWENQEVYKWTGTVAV